MALVGAEEEEEEEEVAAGAVQRLASSTVMRRSPMRVAVAARMTAVASSVDRTVTKPKKE